eukprot:CAMPEP_0172304434 /NCGR_PEP_ID=MMETSP1058-20130122/5843_1 /TAXON_ID=83371 /ORGANISM="Detonula confervacea, Strain CCMP 353" /LENGTH=940 /DNA_ID=CAMNT_0013015659 /DNA_START=144 /DNA_END=2966 /DNA_ORIENTATION=+
MTNISTLRLVNLSPRHTNNNNANTPILLLPGPFVIMQGSPGDGMANTVDSMPMLPPPSLLNATTAASGTTSRCNSAASEELDSEVSQGENGGGDNCNNNEPAVACPTSPLATDNSKYATRRPRSNSKTEGGLHLPLGTSSTIMRNAMNNFISSSGGGYNNDNTSSPLRGAADKSNNKTDDNNGGDELWEEEVSLPLENDNDENEQGKGGSPLFLKQKSNYASAEGQTVIANTPSDDDIISSANDIENNGASTETINAKSEEKEQDNGNNRPLHSSKTPEELQAIQKWQHECSRQELSHFDEANENIKLLIHRRKRTREREALRNVRRNNNSSMQQQNIRSMSTSPPLVTATSASSSSSSSSSDESLSQQLANNSTTVTATADAASTIAASKEKEKDPLTEITNALELANNHRTWYQKDGRLIVFESLPHMSLQGVVTHPVTIREGASNNKDVVTLAPGCAVMAEAAYILDSITLRQVYPITTTPGKPRGKSKKSSSNSTPSGPQLAFLKITAPSTGYILSSVHSYPLLLPGLPTTYTNIHHWPWRITCQPDGAYVRKGLELVTDHIGTLPYGTVCCVTKKVVNGMGLNRLRIEAHLEKVQQDDNDDHDQGDGNNASNASNEDDAFGMIKYSGYISEFLNPLSGQRGNVAEPLPFPVPALYKVIHSKGCVIRSGVELSTTQIGFAPPNSILSIIGRSYSDHPGHNCIERLKLAGGGGWISVTLNKRPPGNEALVSMVGVDGSFDPNDPAKFHFESMRKVMEELHADNGDGGGTNGNVVNGSNSINTNASGSRSEARATFRRCSSYADLSEIGDDDAQSSSSVIPDINTDGNVGGVASSTLSISPGVPTLFRSGVVGGVGGPCASSMDAIRESSGDNHHHNNSNNPNRCLICLSDERTATIVHGETGHIACCLTYARILKARGDNCPVCRLPIDLVIQQFWA